MAGSHGPFEHQIKALRYLLAFTVIFILTWNLVGIRKEDKIIYSQSVPEFKINQQTDQQTQVQVSVPQNGECPLPCEYPEEVDIRVIVLTYNRPRSLTKCLNSVASMELDGARAAIEVWIDRNTEGAYDVNTEEAARNFTWNKGIYRVHIHKQHVGLYGQWMDTWRPPAQGRELAIILEDDTDVSPWAYRWLKAAYQHYEGKFSFCGVSLDSDHPPTVKYQGKSKAFTPPSDDVVYLFRHHHNWGLSPHPKYWRLFQDWLKGVRHDKKFHPYVEADQIWNGWYRGFEKTHKESSMWEMWYSYFTNKEKIWCIYSNTKSYIGKHLGIKASNNSFAYNRKEAGLHYGKTSAQLSQGKLISNWHDYYINFPDKPKKYDYNGQPFRGKL